MFTAWRKSSYSGGSSQSTCVEVAPAPARVGIRDTKARDRGQLTVSRTTWRAFTRFVRRPRG